MLVSKYSWSSSWLDLQKISLIYTTSLDFSDSGRWSTNVLQHVHSFRFVLQSNMLHLLRYMDDFMSELQEFTNSSIVHRMLNSQRSNKSFQALKSLISKTQKVGQENHFWNLKLKLNYTVYHLGVRTNWASEPNRSARVRFERVEVLERVDRTSDAPYLAGS